jgi:hypothetical protein
MSENGQGDALEQQAVAMGVQVELVNRRFKTGANWFFWIAGLSLVNSIVFLTGGGWGFVVGLGVTQIVDILAIEAAAEGSAASMVKAAALAVDALFAGIFVLFGVLARRKHPVAFITGMILYGLDGLLFIPVHGWLWLGLAFHILALIGLYGGLKALRQLSAIEQALASAAEGPIAPPPSAGADEGP